MRTNCEDVGERYFDILMPVPIDRAHADKAPQPSKGFYQGLAKVQHRLRQYLDERAEHHLFLGTAAEPTEDVEAVDDNVEFRDGQ